MFPSPYYASFVCFLLREIERGIYKERIDLSFVFFKEGRRRKKEKKKEEEEERR